MNTLTIRKPDDMHLHLRDGAEMQSVARFSASQFARAIIMPNLNPPVRTVADAMAYRDRVLQSTAAFQFQPLMTLYLTESTSTDDIRAAAENPDVHALKYYPAGATTNSENGVTDIQRVYPVLEEMAHVKLPLLVHGEVTDAEVDVFDREARFIETILDPLRRNIPELKIVFEHITTRQGVEFVQSCDNNVAATITPQHCLMNRNALFQGGLRPHHYCLPVLKAEDHRQAVLNAATSGDARFFLGTDSAPHDRMRKECAHGCAGIFSALTAIELYAEIFEQNGALDNLEAFASEYGAHFYGLPLNEGTITLEKNNWTVPDSLPYATDSDIIPFYSDETLSWKLTRN